MLGEAKRMGAAMQISESVIAKERSDCGNLREVSTMYAAALRLPRRRPGDLLLAMTGLELRYNLSVLSLRRSAATVAISGKLDAENCQMVQEIGSLRLRLAKSRLRRLLAV